jgi:hypothetical protein
MALVPLPFGTVDGVNIILTIDDGPRALAVADPLYDRRFEVRRILLENNSGKAYRFKKFADPNCGPAFEYTSAAGDSVERNVPRNTHYVMWGPDSGHSIPYEASPL